MVNKDRYIQATFLSPNELIDNTVKTRTLNIIAEKIRGVEAKIPNGNGLLNAIDTLKSILEDAYIVSMYKFQFKIFTMALNKELEIIEKSI